MQSKMKKQPDVVTKVDTSARHRRLVRLRKDAPYYAMMVIPVLYFALFCYLPMFGLSMAFQDYRTGQLFVGGNIKWVGLQWFKQAFSSPFFGRWVKNTLLLSFYNIGICFPMAIGLALLLNEVRIKWFRKLAANISLLPYFISTVVIVGIMTNMFSVDDGIINQLIVKLGGEKINFMASTKWFRTMYTGSTAWQGVGFNAVVFTAAIAGIDPTLYEAAELDGSTRLKNILYITIPCIIPTIIIMLMLRIGSIMSVGYEKIILMYSPSIYEVSDTLSTYSFRAGISEGKVGLSTAVEMFNSVCNLLLIIGSNWLSKRYSETSLW